MTNSKIIWICWFQGWSSAPHVVQRCLSSWQDKNTDWDIRCLDKDSLRHYISLPSFQNKTITHASFSDVLRIHLLKEYGGVWVDATLFCNKPLDDWLDDHLQSGFFAFHNSGPDRLVSSWFLAAKEQNYIVDRVQELVEQYWLERNKAHHYFWFHHLFGELYDNDEKFRVDFDSMPKVSADVPHSVQRAGLLQTDKSVIGNTVDWNAPVFKLTHRYNEKKYNSACLLWTIIEPKNFLSRMQIQNRVYRLYRTLFGGEITPSLAEGGKIDDRDFERDQSSGDFVFGSLKVSSENIGDHIQIIAANRLLKRFNIEPSQYIDRDNEISRGELLSQIQHKLPILINGWFKTNREEWPPNEILTPIFLGFHIRLHQCPELVAPDAIEYYKKYEPIGCRDSYTCDLLKSYGVESFESNCFSLSLPRRSMRRKTQCKGFAVSRDDRLLSILPCELGKIDFINHYSGSNEFDFNADKAEEILALYRDEAALIITTLLHCALPAIAMGIPVVVFYPQNSPTGHQSDLERFSSLAKLMKIHLFEEADSVNWNPSPISIGKTKLSLIDSLKTALEKWPRPKPKDLSWIAPNAASPPSNL